MSMLLHLASFCNWILWFSLSFCKWEDSNIKLPEFTRKRLFIIVCLSAGFAWRMFSNAVLFSRSIWESSVVRTPNGWGFPYKTPISPNISLASAFLKTCVRIEDLCDIPCCPLFLFICKFTYIEWCKCCLLDHAHQYLQLVPVTTKMYFIGYEKRQKARIF